jgi:hypothetical protein
MVGQSPKARKLGERKGEREGRGGGREREKEGQGERFLWNQEQEGGKPTCSELPGSRCATFHGLYYDLAFYRFLGKLEI